MMIKEEPRMDDHQWLEHIMSEYGEALTRMAYLYLKDWKLSEDAVQETFIKCFIKRREFRGDSSIKTWIYSILSNTCRDMLKSAYFRKVVLLTNHISSKKNSSDSTELEAIKYEEELHLAQSVLTLPLKYREVIILFYYQDFSIKEISNTLNINENTVKVRLNRGRKKLKKIVKWED